MAIATLDAIIGKVRRLTSSLNSTQLTDDQIIDYLNSFYLYDFPAEFRALDLKDTYTFNTIAGIDTYPFDIDHWINVQEPCYVAKRNVSLFQDKYAFYQYNFNTTGPWQQIQTLTTASTGTITNITQANPGVVTSVNHGLLTGNQILISDVVGMTEVNGVTFTITVLTANTFSIGVDTTAYGAYVSGGSYTVNAFSGTLQNTPIIRSIMNNPMVTTRTAPTSVFPVGYPPSFGQANIGRIQNFLITANIANGNTLNITDDGAGNLIGDIGVGANSVNYSTGLINVTFSSPIPSGNDVNVWYNPVVLNTPLAIYYGQNQLVLRPVPDKGYIVELTAYRLPSQALLGTLNTSAPDMTGRPEEKEWWECLAVGTAKKVYEDRLDMDGVAMMDKMLQERYQVCYSRTYANLGKRRIATIYADQMNFTNTVGPFGASTLS